MEVKGEVEMMENMEQYPREGSLGLIKSSGFKQK